jgi:hypothetical protein
MSVAFRGPPVASCLRNATTWPDPFAPAPLQSLHHYYESVRPNAPLRYSRLTVFRRLCFSLDIRALVPAVPCKSLHPIHVLSTPVAVCPVIRHPTDLSQRRPTPLVSTTFEFLTTRLRRVHFRSSLGCVPAQGIALNFDSNAHHHGSLPQQLGVI